MYSLISLLRGPFLSIFVKAMWFVLYANSTSLQIAPEDIRWESGDPRVSHREGYHGPGHSMNHPVRQNNAPGVGRGRGVPLGQSRKDFLPPLAGIGKNRVKRSDDINLLDTTFVIREVSINQLGVTYMELLLNADW